MRDELVRRRSRIHRALYRISGGMIGRRLVNNDMLLLTTIGRQSGLPHTVPLLYLRNGVGWVVIASYGGRDRHPAWYLNLIEEPSVEIQISRQHFLANARTATDEERAHWWPLVVEAYGDYAVYQTRTDRVIPVVLVDPVRSTVNGHQ